MSVLIKRSEGAISVNECGYGCCTPLYNSKSVKASRRSIKRRDKAKWKREEGVTN